MKTRQEVQEQYIELQGLVSNVATYKAAKSLLTNIDFKGIQINNNPIAHYKEAVVRIIRYKYKNIMVYFDIVDGAPVYPTGRQLTVLDDKGFKVFCGLIKEIPC